MPTTSADEAANRPAFCRQHLRSILCAFVLALPHSALAQAEFWAAVSDQSGTSLRKYDLTTTALLTSVPVPGDVCVDDSVISQDRRWFFVLTTLGIARFEVATGRLVELIPAVREGPGIDPSRRL
jgi:hypothetical protein